jgi:hypothetical protein
MKNILLSILKSKTDNLIYFLLLFTLLLTVGVLSTSLGIGGNLQLSLSDYTRDYWNERSGANRTITEENRAEYDINRELNAINYYLYSIHRFRFYYVLAVIFLGNLILPFIQYLFIKKRGYEIGVTRALGITKTRAWLRLLVENALLSGAAIILVLTVLLVGNRRLMHFVIGLDNQMERLIIENLGEGVLVRGFGIFSALGILPFVITAILTLFTTSLLMIRIINKNAPLKLIADHK